MLTTIALAFVGLVVWDALRQIVSAAAEAKEREVKMRRR
jgi:hypothetical protein